MALNDNPVIKSTYSCSLGKVRKLTTLRITLFFYGVWGGPPASVAQNHLRVCLRWGTQVGL